MEKRERKNAYADNVRTITSKFDADTTVTFLTVKHAELDMLIGQLKAVKEAGKNARIEISYKEKTGKFGNFVGGSIKASAAKERDAEASGGAATGSDDYPF